MVSIPPACDTACARGCFGMGPNDCDVCAPGYYRDVTTLTCARSCTRGTAVHGYCYKSSDPDPVCARTKPPSNALGTCSASSTTQLMVDGVTVMAAAIFVMHL